MFNSTVRRAAETVGEATPVNPAELVTLAALAAEGFGPWDSPYTKGPRDVIEALARQLDSKVVHDDLGRRCVSRETARRLFAERAGGRASLAGGAAASPRGAGRAGRGDSSGRRHPDPRGAGRC
jgi:hypothetical protein